MLKARLLQLSGYPLMTAMLLSLTLSGTAFGQEKKTELRLRSPPALSPGGPKRIGNSDANLSTRQIPSAMLGLNLRQSASGAVIATDVFVGSRAYLAGLRSGDQLKAIDGHNVHSVEDVANALSEYQLGHEIKLTVIPGDQVRELNLIPEAERNSPSDPMLGLILGENAGAVVVLELFMGGPAEVAGVRSGDRIVAVGSHQISTRAQLLRVIREGQYRPGDALDLLIDRDGWERHMPVALAGRGQVSSLPRRFIPDGPKYRAVRARQTAAREADLQWTDNALNIFDVNRRALYTAFD